jgi:hypothetical protein
MARAGASKSAKINGMNYHFAEKEYAWASVKNESKTQLDSPTFFQNYVKDLNSVNLSRSQNYCVPLMPGG